MPLDLDNDKYLAPPEVDEYEYQVQVSVTVTYVHTTSVSATSENDAEAIVKECQKQIISNAVDANEHTDVVFEIDYISDPKDY